MIINALVCAAAAVALAPAAAGSPGPAPTGDQLRWQHWYDQGGRAYDAGIAITSDDVGTFVVAESIPTVGERTGTVVLRYSPEGALAWSTQVGRKIVVDRPGDVAAAGGGVVVVGYGDDPSDARRLVVAAVEDGTPLWQRSIPLAGTGIFFRPQVAVSRSGTIHVVGSDGPQMVVASYEADGTHRWTRRLDPRPGKPDEATAVAVDRRGRTYLTGPVGGGFGGFLTARLDRRGRVDWQRLDEGALSSTLGASFVALAADGRVVVTGVTESTCGVHAASTWSFDRRDGDVGWAATEPSTPCALLEPTGLASRPDGSVVVVGTTLASSDYDGVLLSYGPDGAREWLTTFGTGGTDLTRSVVVDPADGSAYAVGATDVAITTMDALVVAVERDGSIRWQQRHDTGSTSDRAVDVTLAPDGTGGADVVWTGEHHLAAGGDGVLTAGYRRAVQD